MTHARRTSFTLHPCRFFAIASWGAGGLVADCMPMLQTGEQASESLQHAGRAAAAAALPAVAA